MKTQIYESITFDLAFLYENGILERKRKSVLSVCSIGIF